MSVENYRIAKCRLTNNIGADKCNHCKDRFVCFTMGEIALREARYGWYSFVLPNDEEGQLFVALARKFLNRRNWIMHLRGRALNRRDARAKMNAWYSERGQNDISVDAADYLVMYLRRRDGA